MNEIAIPCRSYHHHLFSVRYRYLHFFSFSLSRLNLQAIYRSMSYNPIACAFNSLCLKHQVEVV